MLISVSHGAIHDFEILEHQDGYLVQMRDCLTGEVDPDIATLFRTATVAMRYADLAAAFDLRDEPEEDPFHCEAALTSRVLAFHELSHRLSDGGISKEQLAARAEWQRETDRLSYH